MMSDSTNVLTPGRTPGEAIVRDSLAQNVLDHQGKGRVVVTQVSAGMHTTIHVAMHELQAFMNRCTHMLQALGEHTDGGAHSRWFTNTLDRRSCCVSCTMFVAFPLVAPRTSQLTIKPC
jgi:hypothetical protein